MRRILSYQPKALPFLFLTEAWERFGFYVVQGLLVLYMTEYFGYSDNRSYTILGAFTSLAYIAPIAGGWLASRVLTYPFAILCGGLFLVLGYFLLALPFSHTLLYPGLATIIVGNGLLKPNISSLLGAQYTPHDPRRDAGFTIFYIGINLGVFLAGLSSGYIKNWFGWHMSFALASIGLIIGLCTFYVGLRHLKHPQTNLRFAKKHKWQLLLGCFLAIFVLTFLLQVEWLANGLLPCVGGLLLIYLTLLTLKQQGIDRKRMLALNILILSSIVFWALFFQIFSSANLFIDRFVDKQLFGIPLTTTVFYAAEPAFIILLGPMLAWSWQTLGKNKKNPSPLYKFIVGILFTGLAFILLAASTQFPNTENLIDPNWIFAAYFSITIGELLISPIGLSAVSYLAPSHLTGLMMGVWFVGMGFGGIFAGSLAKLSSIPTISLSAAEKLVIYQHAFLDYAYLAFFVAAILFAIQLLLKRFIS